MNIDYAYSNPLSIDLNEKNDTIEMHLYYFGKFIRNHKDELEINNFISRLLLLRWLMEHFIVIFYCNWKRCDLISVILSHIEKMVKS